MGPGEIRPQSCQPQRQERGVLVVTPEQGRARHRGCYRRGGVLRVSAPRYISPDPGHVSLWAHPLGTTREQGAESLLTGHSFCKGLHVCSWMVELLLHGRV